MITEHRSGYLFHAHHDAERCVTVLDRVDHGTYIRGDQQRRIVVAALVRRQRREDADIGEQHPVELHGREDPGERRRSAHGFPQRSLLEDDATSASQIHGDDGERDLRVGDIRIGEQVLGHVLQQL